MVCTASKYSFNLMNRLCTRFSNENDVKRAKAIGVKGVLMKPVSIGDLAEMVRNVIDEVTDRVLAHDSGQVDAITPAQRQSKDWDND
jgi:DNA-binding NarL/FixJ family response regulator